jgi:hypothetical protein
VAYILYTFKIWICFRYVSPGEAGPAGDNSSSAICSAENRDMFGPTSAICSADFFRDMFGRRPARPAIILLCSAENIADITDIMISDISVIFLASRLSGSPGLAESAPGAALTSRVGGSCQ